MKIENNHEKSHRRTRLSDYVLVTGGAGYIGSHSVLALMEVDITLLCSIIFQIHPKNPLPALGKYTVTPLSLSRVMSVTRRW